MNIKNKLISFFIFMSILTLAVINLRNPEKTKFYLFTSKSESISLGSLITLSFLSGYTFSSILSLLSKNNLEKSLDDNFSYDEQLDESENFNFSQELKSDRPPERDIRESQPTISVNYRFVDQDIDSYNSKSNTRTKNNLNNENNDWINNDNDW